MPKLTIDITDSALQELKRQGKARLVGPEKIAQAAVEDHVRHCVLLDRKFRDAALEVDRRAHAA